MKNLGLFLAMTLLSVCCLTSCLDGSNTTTGQNVGVIDFASKGMVSVVKVPSGELYIPEIASLVNKGDLMIGDRLYVYYTLDYDLAENSNAMLEANGYYTVSLNSYVVFEKNYLNYSLTDTATIMTDEVAVLDGLLNGGINGFYDRYMFITHLVNQPENLELRWNLSYDRESMMPYEENGKRYYDLFVRAVPTNTSEKSKVDYPHCVSYDMGSYLREAAQKEKEALGSSYSANNSKFTLRIFYASEIKDDKIVWKSKELEPFILSFLPSEN